MFSKQDIARYYDLSEVHYRIFWDLNKSRSLHYGYWDSSVKNFHEALLNINKILAGYANIRKEDRVLDAGCGVGGSSIWLAKNIGCKVTGISLSDKQVSEANAFAKKETINDLVNFQLKDFTETGFEDKTFNIVWAIESVCHAVSKSIFLKEAFRILQPGGRIIVADFFKKENLQGKDAEQIKRWANGWAIDDYATKENFIKQLSQAGFSNIKFENADKAIMRSAKRLYHAYFVGVIPSFLYRVFNPNASAFGKNNVDTAYLQYKTLKKKLWTYGIVSAEKPPIIPQNS